MCLKLKLMKSQQFRMTDDEMREMLDLSEGSKCMCKQNPWMLCNELWFVTTFCTQAQAICNSWRESTELRKQNLINYSLPTLVAVQNWSICLFV